ncbi:hypothetical protein [Pseudomonas phage PhL_UNISO_PA-DSM_ph0041x]|nr:hypothetical protein [Pseudomonas phage PhL_UNISO_PA-DSM_ph0041x]
MLEPWAWLVNPRCLPALHLGDLGALPWLAAPG